MFDHMIGRVGLAEGIAGMAALPAGSASGFLPQTPGLGWIGEVAGIRRGSFVAGAAVAFQRGDLRFQLFDPIPQGENQIGDRSWIAFGKLDELFTGGSLAFHKEH